MYTNKHEIPLYYENLETKFTNTNLNFNIESRNLVDITIPLCENNSSVRSSRSSFN